MAKYLQIEKKIVTLPPNTKGDIQRTATIAGAIPLDKP